MSSVPRNATWDVGHELLKYASAQEAIERSKQLALRPNQDPAPVVLSPELERELVVQLGLPPSWFVRDPSRTNVPIHHCWGWRSELEKALLRADILTAQNVVACRAREDVCEFLERRMVLSRAAAKGLASVCTFLVSEQVGCFVDGVRDPRNRSEWRICQEGTGNNGNVRGFTPLLMAIEDAQADVVEVLLQARADPNLGGLELGGSALHLAAARMPQSPRIVSLLLADSRTNVHLRDNFGQTPLQLAEMTLDCGGNLCVVALLRNESAGLQACATCKKPARGGGKLKQCPCGIVVYCDSACQRGHWLVHKLMHNATAIAKPARGASRA
jgi:hypothetical protein